MYVVFYITFHAEYIFSLKELRGYDATINYDFTR